jgi:prepilin-type N-terminal cleavage/methylation domain-containing protein/prepilin-type processing-associated H-X9-DG protein
MRLFVQKKRDGLTLIELLVVIAIIAILAGLLLPSVARAKKQGQSVRCLGNVRQIAVASAMYGHDFDAHVGYIAGSDRKMLLFPYLTQGRSNSDTNSRDVWFCPNNDEPTRGASYGFNTYLNWAKMTSIGAPSDKVDLADAGINDVLAPVLSTHLYPPSALTTPGIGRPNPRHSQSSVNVGFVDGHSKTIRMAPPFYPDVVGKWLGNGITDPNDANYKDQMWDLH